VKNEYDSSLGKAAEDLARRCACAASATTADQHLALAMAVRGNIISTAPDPMAHARRCRWHTSDVMGIGSNGPPDASAADIEGWGAEQVCFFLVRRQGSGHPAACIYVRSPAQRNGSSCSI
jgi:hypothetical protein